jgi:hypothetical protein
VCVCVCVQTNEGTNDVPKNRAHRAHETCTTQMAKIAKVTLQYTHNVERMLIRTIKNHDTEYQ